MGIISAIHNNELWRFRKYRYYQAIITDYKKKCGLNPFQIAEIHRRGFTVNDWFVLRMTKDNYKKFLSTKDYFSIHPINGKYSEWIDDKLTLKYMLNGTVLSKIMPDYYYMIDDAGKVKALMDCPEEKEHPSLEDIVALLEDKGTLALKMEKGRLGVGFYKAEFKDGRYFLNKKAMNRAELLQSMSALKEYIVQEFLFPHPFFADFCPGTANTLRYVACRVDGRLQFFKSYARFGTKTSGLVENFGRGGVLCYIDENGNFKNGYVRTGKNGYIVKDVTKHPDSGKELSGTIPHWDDIIDIVEKMGHLFPQLKYLGFDFVVTADEKVKLLEINSQTSLDTIELDVPVFETKVGRAFFGELLKKTKNG